MTDQHNRKEYNERRAERWTAEIGPANQPNVHEFLEMKLGQGVASGTRLNYAIALAKLDGCLAGKPFSGLDHADVGRFMATMRLQGATDDHLRITASSLKHFLKWLRGSDELPFRVKLAFRVRKNRQLPPRPVVTAEEQQLLLQAAPTMRDQCIIGLLLEGGFRVGELVNLNVGSIHWSDSGTAWVELPVMGEGLKRGSRRVPIARYAGLLHAYVSGLAGRDDKACPSFAWRPFDLDPAAFLVASW